MRGTKPEGCGRREMEEKGHLDGKKRNDKKRNEGSGTNLDRSDGCTGARTGMTRGTPRAKEDAKEGQGSQRGSRHQQSSQAE